MERYNNYSKTESKLCKKTLVLMASIILIISSTIYFIGTTNANPGIVEIASVSSRQLLENDVSLAEDQLISIHYKPINVPDNADIRIFSSNLEDSLAYATHEIDLSQRLSYSFNANLANGVYAAMVSSPDIATKVVPFSVKSDHETVINLGSFELYQGQGSISCVNGVEMISIAELQV